MMRDTESTRYRFWLGSAAALTSAVAFSSNVVLSKLAYDFGANLHALNLVRAVVLLVCLLLAVWLSGAVDIRRATDDRDLVVPAAATGRCGAQGMKLLFIFAVLASYYYNLS